MAATYKFHIYFAAVSGLHGWYLRTLRYIDQYLYYGNEKCKKLILHVKLKKIPVKYDWHGKLKSNAC